MKTNWPTKKLGELFEITSSKRVFKSEWVDDGVPFYRAREIVSLSKGKDFKTPIFITNQMYGEYKDKYGVPTEGDLLATGVGTLGICYRIKRDDKFYFKDGNIIWLKNISGINPRYVELYFQSTNFNNQVEEYAGGATVKTFTIQTAKKIEIPLPPVGEQRKIVARIEKQFAKIDEAARLRAESQVLTEKLLPSALHEIFSSAESKGWKIVSIKEVCEHPQYGFTASSSRTPIGPRLLRITDIQGGKVDWDTVPYCKCDDVTKYQLKQGDVVFARTGATVGKSFLISEVPKQAIFASYLIRLRVKEDISPEFLYYFFQSPDYWGQITDGQVGMAQPNVNGTRLAQIKIPIPPPAEQKRIVEKLDALSEKVRALSDLQSAQSAALKSFKQSILHEAFSN